MSAWYREIDVGQEPFDLGVDAQQRSKVVFNIAVVKRPSDKFAEEILGLLVAAGVGTANVDIFVSSKRKLPTDDGPYLSLIETGGTTPERTQNDISPPAYPRPSMQLVARAKSYDAARIMARNAYNALVGIRNQIVAG